MQDMLSYTEANMISKSILWSHVCLLIIEIEWNCIWYVILNVISDFDPI